MNFATSKGPLHSEVSLPGSKSYANRALILGALKKDKFTIRHLPSSTDVTILLACLRQMGLLMELEGDKVTILNSFPECESSDTLLEVGEGGTTARFLAALVLRGRREYRLILGERLKERPWQEFITLVIKHGGRAELNGRELLLQGPVSFPPDLEVDCTRTTQFASALKMVFADEGTRINPIHLLSSQSYWEMTSEMIDTIKAHSCYDIPLDWSSASYPLAFGALEHPVFLPGLYRDSSQADSKFFDILKEFGAIQETPDGISVHPVKISRSFTGSVEDCLDLVPALSFFLSHIEGTHELHGVKNLVHKESNRLQEVMKLLDVFEKKSEAKDDALIIHGSSRRIDREVQLTMPDDHRMVMTGVLFLRHHSGGTITPIEAVKKSYPDFLEILKD